MPPFLVHEGREYYQLALARPASFERPFPSQPYPCLVWDHKGSWQDTDRDVFARALIASDCRYAVCGGVFCEQWHDKIDLVFVQTVPDGESDARFIMTTWHSGEPPLEVAWFFAWNTPFDDHDFAKFLVIELGEPLIPSAIVDSVTRAVTDSEGVIDELSPDAG
jgi:hypothetical protein